MTTYYYLDVTKLPFHLIRAATKDNPIACARCSLRKVLRWPFPPRCGDARPESSGVLLEWEQIPREMQKAMEPHVAARRWHGMAPLRCLKRLESLGAEAYGVVFIDPTSSFISSITAPCLRQRSEKNIPTVTNCTSWLNDGRVFATQTVDPITEFLVKNGFCPVGVDFTSLPPDTPVDRLIVAHKERIQAPGISVVQLNDELTRSNGLRLRQAYFDTFMKSGFFTPLSEKDVQRLQRGGWN